MKVRLAACLLFTSVPALAQDAPWNCDDWANLPQQGLNMCSYEDFQKADRALNIVWPKLRQWAKDVDQSTREWRPELAKAEENLLKAQRAWIDYRDGHCETEGMSAAGGSMQPLLINSCMASLTRKRTEELLLLMDDG